MDVFVFLRAEFPEIYGGASRAYMAVLEDPRTACFHARWTIEQAFGGRSSTTSRFRSRMTTRSARCCTSRRSSDLIGDQVFRMAREAIRLGNRAAHDPRPVSRHDSVAAVSQLFQFSYWFARTYCREEKPPADLSFDPRTLPRPRPPHPSTTAQIQEMQRALDESEAVRKRFEEELLDKAKLIAELEQLRSEVAEAKVRAKATPDTHDYSEAETRDFFIDLLLARGGLDA